MKHGQSRFGLIPFRMMILALLGLSLSGCITLPGHRQTIDDEGFYLHLTAPYRATRGLIRFNADQTGLFHMPAGTRIELVVSDLQGEHDLEITGSPDAITYDYRLNGRRIEFGTEQQAWFASQVPGIIRRTGLISILE